MKKPWRRVIFRFITIYLVIGFLISLADNLGGLARGNTTAFAWTGSLRGNAILFFWWFILPAIIWPYDLYWTVYWKVFR